jgi:hypothetical protein
MAGNKAHELKHIDSRVVERYVRKGVVPEKEYKQLIKDLPDLEGAYDVINVPEDLKSARAEDESAEDGSA